jgi:hypothetical protein
VKKNFRFHIDLRPKAPPPPREAMVLNEETRREQAWQARLLELAPAWLDADDYEDPLTAQEHLEAYNASLRRAQHREVGEYEENGLYSIVTFEGSGEKLILSLLAQAPSARISQLALSPDGELVRYSLEQQDGEPRDLRALLHSGLACLSSEDLAFYRGYLWIRLHYVREEDRLARVTQTSRICRKDSEHVDFFEEVLID